jgi:hypothetical protein
MARRPQKPPDLSDPKAKSKLEIAAAAIGFTVEQLCNLAADAAIVSPKASPELTERYTLLDLGQRLWAEMQMVDKQHRPSWFEPLLDVQKGALIVALRDHGFRSEVIARDLQLSPEDVLRTWNTYCGRIGAQVVSIRLDTIAGQLQLAAERAQQMAIEAGDHRTYWSVSKDYVAILQSIGVVDRAIHRVEVSHTLDDRTRGEIDKLVELEHKRTKSKIELIEIGKKTDESDAIPEEIRGDDELDD